MKMLNLIIVIISIIIAAWLLLSIDEWARDWKRLFFYLDDWQNYLIVLIIVAVLGYIVKKFVIVEAKLLK